MQMVCVTTCCRQEKVSGNQKLWISLGDTCTQSSISAAVRLKTGKRKEQDGLDIESLLRDAPSLFVTEPIFENVRTMLAQQQESFYFSLPEVTGEKPVAKWLEQFEHDLTRSPFRKVLYEKYWCL